MRAIALIIGLFLYALNGFSQTDSYRIGLNIGLNYGYQLTNPTNNKIYNTLKQKQRLGVLLKLDFYINRNWGIYLKTNGTSLISNFSEKELNTHFQSLYGSEYYISNSKFHRNEGADRPAYSFVSLGGIYQITRAKWTYQFGLGAGVALLDNPEYSYVMKVKGTNQYYKKELQLKTENPYNFYFEPSVKVSYQINNRLRIFIAGLYTVLPSHRVSYNNLETNLYTENSTEETTYQNKWYQMGQLNLGLTIGLWKTK